MQARQNKLLDAGLLGAVVVELAAQADKSKHKSTTAILREFAARNVMVTPKVLSYDDEINTADHEYSCQLLSLTSILLTATAPDMQRIAEAMCLALPRTLRRLAPPKNIFRKAGPWTPEDSIEIDLINKLQAQLRPQAYRAWQKTPEGKTWLSLRRDARKEAERKTALDAPANPFESATRSMMSAFRLRPRNEQRVLDHDKLLADARGEYSVPVSDTRLEAGECTSPPRTKPRSGTLPYGFQIEATDGAVLEDGPPCPRTPMHRRVFRSTVRLLTSSTSRRRCYVLAKKVSRQIKRTAGYRYPASPARYASGRSPARTRGSPARYSNGRSPARARGSPARYSSGRSPARARGASLASSPARSPRRGLDPYAGLPPANAARIRAGLRTPRRLKRRVPAPRAETQAGKKSLEMHAEAVEKDLESRGDIMIEEVLTGLGRIVVDDTNSMPERQVAAESINVLTRQIPARRILAQQPILLQMMMKLISRYAYPYIPRSSLFLSDATARAASYINLPARQFRCAWTEPMEVCAVAAACDAAWELFC